jgi:hypothetical protein
VGEGDVHGKEDTADGKVKWSVRIQIPQKREAFPKY